MGELMIPWCKERGSFTNAFSSNLNTVNLKVFPKHGQIGFILEVNSSEVSNVVSCSVSLMLTRTWDIDILFEKLTPEIGVWKTPFGHSRVWGGGGEEWVGDFMQSLYSFLTSFVRPILWCIGFRALLDLSNYWLDYWRRYNIKGVCWCHIAIIKDGASLKGGTRFFVGAWPL